MVIFCHALKEKAKPKTKHMSFMKLGKIISKSLLKEETKKLQKAADVSVNNTEIESKQLKERNCKKRNNFFLIFPKSSTAN